MSKVGSFRQFAHLGSTYIVAPGINMLEADEVKHILTGALLHQPLFYYSLTYFRNKFIQACGPGVTKDNNGHIFIQEMK